MADSEPIGRRSRLGLGSTRAAGRIPARRLPPPARRWLAASRTLVGLRRGSAWSRPIWRPAPRLGGLRVGRFGLRLIGRHLGLLHRLFRLRELITIHVRRPWEILDRLTLGSGFHVLSPGQCRIGAAEEGAVVGPSVFIKITIAVVACHVHHRCGDLSGVGDEPSRDDVAGAVRVGAVLGSGLAGHGAVECLYLLAGSLLDHTGKREGDVVRNILVDRALFLRMRLVDDLALAVPYVTYHVVGDRDAVIGKRGVRAGLGEWAHLGGAQRNAVVVVPAAALGGTDRLGHLHDLARTIVHLGGEIHECGVDRVRGRLDEVDRLAVLVAELVANRGSVAWRGPGVAVEGVAQAETVLEAGSQGVRLERRGGRACRGGPVAAVL